MEGFPSNADDCGYLGDAGLFPDAAVLLNVQDTDVVGRLLPPKLQKWKERRDRRNEKRRKIKEKRQKKRVNSVQQQYPCSLR